MMVNEPSKQELQAGEERYAFFIALTPGEKIPHEKKEIPEIQPTYILQKFPFEHELSDWKTSSTTFVEEILPLWKSEYHGRRTVAVMKSSHQHFM